MDYSQLPNPYDFANPVNDPNLFAGRSSVLEEIRYYLDHGRSAPRAINLAIIGGRASGKTSVLNMIQHEAEQRKFCAVRVDLDEDDGRSQLVFFYKLFDSIFTTLCSYDYYGGLQGESYDSYRTIVDTYVSLDNQVACPFIFPVQYAKAMSVKNKDAQLSDISFKIDMQSIYKVTKKPIIIIMDECDVLGKSRVHLEKLRNIFMNIPGYMLVATGTENFFPLIDDVFSPIVRQFKKINIGPFNKEEETLECIRRPLQNLDINPLEIFDMESYFDATAIHDLSGGRPYEIQLLCHLLFRRVKQGRAEKMELTSDILDEVLHELQSSQDTSIRQSISKIRNLEPEQLSALKVLCSTDGYANFEQAWFHEYVFRSKTTWTKDTLSDHMQYLRKINLISTNEENVISFVGDDFDRLYCKYYARKHKVELRIERLPLEEFAYNQLGNLLREEINDLKELAVEGIDILGSDITEMSSMFLNKNDVAIPNPFDANPELATHFYRMNFEFYGNKTFQLLGITLATAWYKIRRFYGFELASDVENKIKEEKVRATINRLANQADDCSAKVETETYILPVIESESLAIKLRETKNQSIKKQLYGYHSNKMVGSYMDGEKELALVHGDLCYSFIDSLPDQMDTNNLGYLFMAYDRLDQAELLLKKSISYIAKNKDSDDGDNNEYELGEDDNYEDDENEHALPKYNLAIVYAKKNKLVEAVELMESAKAELLNSDEAYSVSCLFRPIDKDNDLSFEEVFEPNLLNTIDDAISVVIKYLNNKK